MRGGLDLFKIRPVSRSDTFDRSSFVDSRPADVGGGPNEETGCRS